MFAGIQKRAAIYDVVLVIRNKKGILSGMGDLESDILVHLATLTTYQRIAIKIGSFGCN